MLRLQLLRTAEFQRRAQLRRRAEQSGDVRVQGLNLIWDLGPLALGFRALDRGLDVLECRALRRMRWCRV